MTDVDLDSGDPPWAEDDAPERYENTDDMFGAPAPAPESKPVAEAKPVQAIPVSTEDVGSSLRADERPRVVPKP